MEIKRTIECGDDIKEKLSEVYINAFYDEVLKYFSKDKAKLKKAFAHGFMLEYFYVARLLQNFSFARATAENRTFRSPQGEKLHSLCKTNRVLQEALAIIDNEIAGIIACMGKGQFCFKVKIKTLVKYLGIFKLGFRAVYMKTYIGVTYIGMKYTKEQNNGINGIKTIP